MDISETYIKMADWPEIQNECRFREGDWFVNPSGDRAWKNPDAWMILQDMKSRSFKENRKFMKGLIWLPTQDRIQKMMGKTELVFCIYQIENKWGGEIYQDREQIFTIKMDSPEQLWLCFYRWKKYKKMWVSKKWIRIK